MESNKKQPNDKLRYQREIRGWSQKKVALSIGTSKDVVSQWECGKQVPSRYYQDQLCKLFEKNAEELGFMNMSQATNGTEETQGLKTIIGTPECTLILFPYEVQSLSVQLREINKFFTSSPSANMYSLFEGILSYCWNLYYTSNIQQASQIIGYWQQVLYQIQPEAGQFGRSHLFALQSRFFQLSAVIERDQLDLVKSLKMSANALARARTLDNPELLTAALFRRARSYLQKFYDDLATGAIIDHHLKQGLSDLEEALSLAPRLRDPLRCYVTICYAEILSLRTPVDPQTQSTCLALLDTVESTVRTHSTLKGDGSFTCVDVPGLFLERANILTRFGMFSQAEEALSITRKHLGPKWIRWQSNLCLAQAQAAFAKKAFEESCKLALDTLCLVRLTSSRGNEQKIDILFQNLKQQQLDIPQVNELGRQLGYL